jgi:hypothetical protein
MFTVEVFRPLPSKPLEPPKTAESRVQILRPIALTSRTAKNCGVRAWWGQVGGVEGSKLFSRPSCPSATGAIAAGQKPSEIPPRPITAPTWADLGPWLALMQDLPLSQARSLADGIGKSLA